LGRDRPIVSDRQLVISLINIRKLAALDLVFHGPRFVLIEQAGRSQRRYGTQQFLLVVPLIAAAQALERRPPGSP
jgi:hypothetical protein